MKKILMLAVLLTLISIGAQATRRAFVIGMPGVESAPITNWQQNTKMVEDAFREGGYDTQAVYDPGFAYSFPDLDSFLKSTSINDDIVIYYSGLYAGEFSSVFLLPSGFNPAQHKLALDTYNVQRLLNRLRDHNAPLVLILDLYPRPDFLSVPQNLAPSLILKKDRQVAVINVYDPLTYFTAQEKGIFPKTIAKYISKDTLLQDKILSWIAKEVDDAAEGAISPRVLGTIDTDSFEGMYELYAPTKAFDLFPTEEDGGGSYSF